MGILLITDVILSLYYRVPILSRYMALNYVAYAALIGLGRRFSARSSWLHLLGGGLLGVFLFYFITTRLCGLILRRDRLHRCPIRRRSLVGCRR